MLTSKASALPTSEENQQVPPVEDPNDATGESHQSDADPGSSPVANKQEERLQRLRDLRMRLVRASAVL